jgi:hypothetical protein
MPYSAKRSSSECTFKELCIGSCQGYACDYLIDITRNRHGDVPTIREAEEMLLEHIDNCVERIETERGCELEYIYIGKTYVRQRKNAPLFDHMNRATWNLGGGINGRCRSHRRRVYGQDGLVVLTVITREAIRHGVRKKFHEEDYALELESLLIQDYWTDPRLYNKTCMPGRRDGNCSVGYALYMAFKVYNFMLILGY